MFYQQWEGNLTPVASLHALTSCLRVRGQRLPRKCLSVRSLDGSRKNSIKTYEAKTSTRQTPNRAETTLWRNNLQDTKCFWPHFKTVPLRITQPPLRPSGSARGWNSVTFKKYFWRKKYLISLSSHRNIFTDKYKCIEMMRWCTCGAAVAPRKGYISTRHLRHFKCCNDDSE